MFHGRKGRNRIIIPRSAGKGHSREAFKGEGGQPIKKQRKKDQDRGNQKEVKEKTVGTRDL